MGEWVNKSWHRDIKEHDSSKLTIDTCDQLDRSQEITVSGKNVSISKDYDYMIPFLQYA